jgi:hypothetical protein
MINPIDERRELKAALAQLNARAWGITIGLLLGGGLFLATVILLVRGGPQMGQHLNLLGAYLPGYRVSTLGSFLGFIYGFVIGYAIGRVIGTVYNRLVGLPK